MTKEEILIESANYIAEYCDGQGECNEDCIFYTKRGDSVCLFGTAYVPCKWDFNTLKESNL